MPSFICSNAAFYKFVLESSYPNQFALRKKAPEGIQFDYTLYAMVIDVALCFGIMLASSLSNAMFKTTCSPGVLVVDKDGEFYVMVATHALRMMDWYIIPTPLEF